jgi:CTP synthase
LSLRIDNLTKKVTIALTGKYTSQPDTYKSIINALHHAGLECKRKVEIKYVDSSDLEVKNNNQVKYHEAWQNVCSCDGVLIPGGFGNRGIEGMVAAANWARLNKKPFLGICLGMQCAVIEFSRNILQLADANSSEFDKNTSNPVVNLKNLKKKTF